jgi:hypothetical protein
MDLKLKDKVALITGSSRGIGLATAKAFAVEGCCLVLSARAAEPLAAAEAALRADGVAVASCLADVGQPDQAARLDKPRESLEFSERHGCAAPLPRDGDGGGRPAERAPVPRVCDGGGGTAERAPFLYRYFCTRFGAAGQGWHQPDDLSENRMQAIVSLAPPGC